MHIDFRLFGWWSRTTINISVCLSSKGMNDWHDRRILMLFQCLIRSVVIDSHFYSADEERINCNWMIWKLIEFSQTFLNMENE